MPYAGPGPDIAWGQVLGTVFVTVVLVLGALLVHKGIDADTVNDLRNLPTVPAPWLPSYGPNGWY